MVRGPAAAGLCRRLAQSFPIQAEEVMGTSDLDLEEYERAVQCAIEAGVFKKGHNGQVYIAVKEPAKAALLLESAGNDNEVVARIVKILSSTPGDED
jgi:hypothetical protein